MPDDFRHRVLDARVLTVDGCLVIPGRTVGHGYTRMAIPRRLRPPGTTGSYEVMIHRAVWIWFHGPIDPIELLVDHDDPEIGCKNRACSNVEHLVLTTPRGNQAGSVATKLQKETCGRGHQFKISSGRSRTRFCPECKTINAQRIKECTP